MTEWPNKKRLSIPYDGFEGDVIGHYVTREGKKGYVVQQDGTKVVHVYGDHRDKAPASRALERSESKWEEYWPKQAWWVLPTYLRRRWWDETNLGMLEPGPELIKAVDEELRKP